MSRPLLGVNIDHVASLRNSRNTKYPNPVYAAFLVEQAGADSITIHLREDRRHIVDSDVKLLKEILQIRMNLEIAVTDEMIFFANKIKPDSCCFVPEKREELTTESGLDLTKKSQFIFESIQKLQKSKIQVSLFVDPEKEQIDAALEMGVKFIEIHTGYYANSRDILEKKKEFNRIKKAIHYAYFKKLKVNVGHGLNYLNVRQIAGIGKIHEFNIGHSIVAESVFVGLVQAVKSMKKIIYGA